ncbi:MAG: hypothetical protein P8K77_06330 [Polaribacter sp.]|nr:hypothetical protein [Polaribacter sp.]
MKKIINKITLLILTISMIGCSEPDNAIYDVFDGVSHGAALRTLDRVSMNFNIFDLNSTFEIVVEEQDEENGKLLSKVNVYIKYSDNTPGGADNSKSDVLASSIPASAFTTSANGLPSTTVKVTFSEALAALGLTPGQYAGGDVVTFRLEVVLTDGRTFSAADTSGSLQGSYFSSPYAYNAGILCIPTSPITGDYVINMQDSYGDGWQGSKVVCTIDGVANEAFLADYWSTGLGPFLTGTQTITIPAGASTVEWSFSAGDWPSEVTFQIIGPNSGNIIGDFGPSPAAGPIALNLCDE